MISKTIIATIALAFQAQAVYLEKGEARVAYFYDSNTDMRNHDLDLQEVWYDRALNPDRHGWFRGSTYHAMSKEEKLNQLWSYIAENQTLTPQLWVAFPEFFKIKANGVFCQPSDEIIQDRQKTTHTQGVHAQVSYVPAADNPFTGMYNEETDAAIIRFSQTVNLHEHSVGLLPSVAMKFLIDGQTSANLFGMPNFVGTDSWNFFKLGMKSRVEPFAEGSIEAQTLTVKQAEGSNRPFVTAVSEPADRYSTGLPVEVVKSPFEVDFRGIPQYDDDKEFDGDNQVMWYDQLMRSKSGEIIMELWGLDAPETERFQGQWHKMGDIKLTTDLIFSEFGDQRLHFQHIQVHKDFAYYEKGWKNENVDLFIDGHDPANQWGNTVPEGVWPETEAEAEQFYIDQIQTHGCPFGWLLGL